MPDIIFFEIRRFGTDERQQTAKVSGIVTDEGKRAFPLYDEAYHKEYAV